MTSLHDMLAQKDTLNGVLVMGIVNTAPDSFSDGSDGLDPVDKALKLLDEGADIIDIGGESTRPDADEIPVDIEIKRVQDVLLQIKKLRPSAVVSIDTRKSKCAAKMLELGADIINDVSGLTYSKDMAQITASFNANLIIMHSCGKGVSAELHTYNNIADEVYDFLLKQKNLAISHGVMPQNIAVDPGLGFSKNTAENCIMLKNTGRFAGIAPVLIGCSRKRFVRELGDVKEFAISDTYSAYIGALSVLEGAKILRVHNVTETVNFLNIMNKIRS